MMIVGRVSGGNQGHRSREHLKKLPWVSPETLYYNDDDDDDDYDDDYNDDYDDDDDDDGSPLPST